MKRPIGVTILAILAVLLAILNGNVTLRFLGFFSHSRVSEHPYFQPPVCPPVRSLVSVVEEDVQFLSDEELQATLEGVPPDLAEEILRINEIAFIKGIRTSLLGPVIITIFGIIVSFFLPPEILVSKKNEALNIPR